MTTQTGRGASRWRASGADLRVSDAERTEVADHLSRHYTDGRLDEGEFSERLDRAMSAKTRADLTGLLADLPGGPPQPRPRRGHIGRFLMLVLIVLVLAAAGQAIIRSYLWLAVIAAAVFRWLRYGPRQHR